MTAEALPFDPALPGLRIASDDGQMLELFRRHLRPLPAADLEIRDCRLSRVHYHRGERCSLRYTLQLVERQTGRERAQWVTGLLYAGERAARIWRKVSAPDPGREVAEAFTTFEPVSFVSELKMLVQVFPYDRHLPVLPRLTVNPVTDLEPVFRAELGLGDWEVEVASIEPVQYRVGRAAVLRYEVEARNASTATSEKRCFYGKVYREAERAERAHRVLRVLRDGDGGDGGFAVARPVAYLRDLRTVVQEGASGTSLERMLREGRDASAVQQAARALARFHQRPTVGLPHHGLDDEVAVLERASRVLGWGCPHLKARVETVVDAVVARLEEFPPAPTHGELKTGHVFLEGELVAVVDLDSTAGSDPVLDPARLLADLAGLRLRLGASDDGRWRAAAHAFAEEYFRRVPAAWRRRLAPHYAGALLKEAVDFFRHLEPGWPEKVPTLIQQAEGALSGAEW